jgi:PKD repeat protein
VISATPANGLAPLTVTFNGAGSTDPDGTVSSWAWSFGDGASGTGSLTTHLYTTPGTFAASLTVTDNGGASSTTTRSIVVNTPSAAAPMNLTAKALSRSSISLKWTNGTTNQTEVRIERCQGSSCTNFTQISTVGGTAATYTDSGLATNTTYRYRVRAHNSAGDSPFSNIAGGRTLRR